ncbi:MAG: hypothetical protein U0514_03865 [Candidatus Andersenbacteria bacterium]
MSVEDEFDLHTWTMIRELRREQVRTAGNEVWCPIEVPRPDALTRVYVLSRLEKQLKAIEHLEDRVPTEAERHYGPKTPSYVRWKLLPKFSALYEEYRNRFEPQELQEPVRLFLEKDRDGFVYNGRRVEADRQAAYYKTFSIAYELSLRRPESLASYDDIAAELHRQGIELGENPSRQIRDFVKGHGGFLESATVEGESLGALYEAERKTELATVKRGRGIQVNHVEVA